MSYQVLLRREAQRQLDKLDGHDYEIVFAAVLSLKNEPRPRGVKKLSDSGFWRVREGYFRIIYAIDDEKREIIVVRVARRDENTYRRL